MQLKRADLFRETTMAEDLEGLEALAAADTVPDSQRRRSLWRGRRHYTYARQSEVRALSAKVMLVILSEAKSVSDKELGERLGLSSVTVWKVRTRRLKLS